MAAKRFVHLHTHTQYSLLDGACRITDLARRARELKMPALAITDHGNLFGAIEFYRAMRAAGVHPILGMEAYVAPDSRHNRSTTARSRPYHLVLLARNAEGYRNLIQLASIGYLEGFYYKPRIDHEVLARHGAGLIGLSGCIQGEVNVLARAGRLDAAEAAARRYAEIFDGRFYLELQDHGLESEALGNERLLDLSRRTGLPLVATNDCHYMLREHAAAHDVLLCIQTNHLRDDPKRLRFESDQLHFRTPEEMAALFEHVPEALQNTERIAEACSVELEFGHMRLPRFPLPEGFAEPESYLEHLAWEGVRARYGEVAEGVEERLRFELDVIRRMGYAGYFLIVRDFIEFARQRKIPVGPGRGSAAGSLVSYCTGITNIDPIRYNLLFERFLNPDRVTMPDIDVDISDRGRGEVIRYVVDRYGAENVCQIITFGTMAARAVVRDVGRVLGMTYAEVDQIAKLIPAEPKMTLEKALGQVPELRELADGDPRVGELLRIARVLEGLTRHASTHAAGVVITPTVLTDYVPLFRGKEGEVTTQFDMNSCEAAGLLKMDLLGLRTLTVVEDTLAFLRQSGIEIDIEALPLDDPEVYALMGRGDTVGVFQFESSGMVEYLKKLAPHSLEDLIAMNALYRPGPLGSGMVETFIARKHGQEPIAYEHPLLEPILKSTYGVMVYQEQVMQIASALGGYSLGEADLLRRAMGKKKAKVMHEQQAVFLTRAKEREIPRATAERIFDLMNYFAGYGFNRSHSAGYAILAYQTAYLKAHHPVAFMAATLTSEQNDSDRLVVLLGECRRTGIAVLPPDVQHSQASFSVEGKAIRFGLAAIKGLGATAAQAIVSAREEGGFHSLFQLCECLAGGLVNRKALEALIHSGALDSLAPQRARLAAALPLAIERAAAQRRDREAGQSSLFAAGEEGFLAEPGLPEVPDWAPAELVRREKEALGFYLTHHPLDPYRELLECVDCVVLGAVPGQGDRTAVRVTGVVTQLRHGTTNRGRPMAVFTLEDFSGRCEVMIFDEALTRCRTELEVEQVVLVSGRVAMREGRGARIFGDRICGLEAWFASQALSLHLALPAGAPDRDLQRLRARLAESPGSCPVFLHIDRGEMHGAVVQLRQVRVALEGALLKDLRTLFPTALLRVHAGAADVVRTADVFGAAAGAPSARTAAGQR